MVCIARPSDSIDARAVTWCSQREGGHDTHGTGKIEDEKHARILSSRQHPITDSLSLCLPLRAASYQ